MTTSLREKAEHIFAKIICIRGNKTLAASIKESFDLIHEALEAAYKQGALARIEGPSDADILCAPPTKENIVNKWRESENERYRFSETRLECLAVQKIMGFLDGAYWYRDNLKITPLTAAELLPSNDEVILNCDHVGRLLAIDKTEIFMNWLRDFVKEKLEQGK